MDKKVILISIDGLRPDAVETCGHSFVNTLKENGCYSPGCKFCCATGYPAGAYLDLLQRTAHPPRDYHQRLHAAGTTDPRTGRTAGAC